MCDLCLFNSQQITITIASILQYSFKDYLHKPIEKLTLARRGAPSPQNIGLTCNPRLARALRKERSDSHGACQAGLSGRTRCSTKPPRRYRLSHGWRRRFHMFIFLGQVGQFLPFLGQVGQFSPFSWASWSVLTFLLGKLASSHFSLRQVGQFSFFSWASWSVLIFLLGKLASSQ